MAKIKIQDYAGANHEIELSLGALHTAEAAKAANVVRHFDTVVTTGDKPSASQQIYAALGLDRKGVTMKQLQAGEAADKNRFEAASVDDSGIVGRLVTSAYLMDAIESKLASSDNGINALFLKKAALVESIPDSRFDRPIIDFTGPESKRGMNVAQLSEPAANVLITASDKSYRIPNNSIGIEFSDQVAQNLTLPIVTLSMQRQAEAQYAEEVLADLKAFLKGDADLDMAALTAVKANSLDASIGTTAGKLTQLAWVKWLNSDGTVRKIDTVVCNLKTALAIEGREGRPTVQGDNPNSKRIDTLENVVNPTWPDQVDIILNEDFDDNDILGFDSRYGYHVVNSTVMSYQATEQYSIRRSTRLRIDHGKIAYRLFNSAFSYLKLSNT